MKEMMGGSYLENVRKTFLPEFISMNAMMAGMAPVMSFLMMGRDMRAMVPTELLFWGVMSFGVIVGFTTAYPWNIWLVTQSLKHGLMTERTPGSKFDVADHKSHGKGGAHNAAHDHHGMASSVTGSQLTAVSGISILTLTIGMIAPATWVNLRLSARDVGAAIMP